MPFPWPYRDLWFSHEKRQVKIFGFLVKREKLKSLVFLLLTFCFYENHDIARCMYLKTFKTYYHIYHKNHQNPIHMMFSTFSHLFGVHSLLELTLLLSETDAELWLWPVPPMSEPQSRGPLLSPYLWCLQSPPVSVVTASPLLESSVHLVSWQVRAITFQFIPFM